MAKAPRSHRSALERPCYHAATEGCACLVALPEVLLVEGDAVGGLLGAVHIVEGVDVRLLNVPNAGLVDASHHPKQVSCKHQSTNCCGDFLRCEAASGFLARLTSSLTHVDCSVPQLTSPS